MFIKLYFTEMVIFNTYVFIKDGEYKYYNLSERWSFFMIDLTWKIFRQTGNINAYLLFKTLQNDHGKTDIVREN